MTSAAAEKYYELLPPSALVVLIVCFFAGYQLAKGGTSSASNVISTGRSVHPLSIESVNTSLRATIKSLHLSLYSSPTAKAFPLVFGTSFLISVCPWKWIFGEDFNLDVISLFGVNRSDFTFQRTAWPHTLTKLSLHWIFISTPDMTLSTAVYWSVFIPLIFFFIFAFLDGAYLSSGFSDRFSGGNRPSSCWTILSNVWLICVAILLSVNINLFLLPDYGKKVALGPFSIIFALFIFLFYRNPIIYTESLGDKTLVLSFGVEVRWVIAVLLTLLLGVTPWQSLLTEMFIGLMTGTALVVLEIMYVNTKCVRGETSSRRISSKSWRCDRYVEMAKIIFEIMIYVLSMIYLPASMDSIPHKYSSVIAKLRAARWSWANFGVLLNSQQHKSLWEMLCMGDPLSRFLAKIFVFWALLLIAVRETAYPRACRLLGTVIIVHLFYALNSPLWVMPDIGFVIHAFAAFRFWTALPRAKELL